MNCLREGFVTYPNPFGGQVYRVSLRSDDVHSIVFWSKDYAPLLDHLDELEDRRYRSYFHYTITGAPQAWEPYAPSWRQSADTFLRLAERTDPRRIQWRFDPIIFTDEQGVEFYVERFHEIARMLAGATARCYFSFGVFYGKVQRKLRRAEIRFLDPPLSQKSELAGKLTDVAACYDITLYSCCQDRLVAGKVKKAHCVDGDLLAELFPDRPHVSKHQPTREQCGCVASRDIGMYDTCPHGCIYCYATQNYQTALKSFKGHSPTNKMLAV